MQALVIQLGGKERRIKRRTVNATVPGTYGRASSWAVPEGRGRRIWDEELKRMQMSGLSSSLTTLCRLGNDSAWGDALSGSSGQMLQIPGQ